MADPSPRLVVSRSKFGELENRSMNGAAVSSWFRETPESLRILAEERAVVAAAELVSAALERRNVSRSDLAEALGVKPPEISQRLSGKRNLTLRSLAAMLHELGYGLQLQAKETVKVSEPSTSCFSIRTMQPVVTRDATKPAYAMSALSLVKTAPAA